MPPCIPPENPVPDAEQSIFQPFYRKPAEIFFYAAQWNGAGTHFISERQADGMKNEILAKYVGRVYGYALNHTFSREEADELSQQILFTALRQLRTLKCGQKFEPWLWGLARNVTRAFRRSQGKRRAVFSFDEAEGAEWPDEDALEQNELYDRIRTEIAMLSGTYRDIIILRYYENLPCKEIAERLGIPEGTVEWRLSEGRRKLKKECVQMTETALRPVKMSIRISGEGNYNGNDIPFPYVFVNDALSQNILYHCYREAKSEEELARLCGVPAYYIEDSAARLKEREALTRTAAGKYRTNFLIYGEETDEYNKKSREYLRGLTDEFVAALKDFTESVVSSGVRTAGRSRNELCYLFGIMAMEVLGKNHNPVEDMPEPVRCDGNRWSYHGILAGVGAVNGLGREENRNDGGMLAHCSYHFGGFAYRPMLGAGIRVCEAIVRGSALPESDVELASNLIRDGYIRRLDGGNLALNIPYFTREQKQAFGRSAEKRFEKIMPSLVRAVQNYVSGYRELFPKHLADEVQRACHYAFVGSFVDIACLAQEKGLLEKPDENSVCDVLTEIR